VFTEDDFATVRTGAVVTKVVVLERPANALPIATSCDNPFELTILPNNDPMIEAQKHGRPLLVLHMGDNLAPPQELACQAVPGTVFLSGEDLMTPPRDPPRLPWMCYPLAVGQLPPEEEICFHDGGDIGAPATVRPDGKLVGLDPSDTVAQYCDGCGHIKIAVSNKVCFCVPRYLLIRTVITPAGNALSVGPGNVLLANAPAKSELELTPVQYQSAANLAAVSSRIKASALVNLQQTQVVGNVEGLVVYTNATEVGNVTGMCAPPEICEPAPLVINKWPDKCELHLGEIVTFFIRYKNEGRRPITGIVVSDSLTARLEYVPNSARSDRDASFTTTPNEVDSSVLRWEVTGALPPGQVGIVSFQARVR
jgi:uncharacterized repeat protein (TIGR01451 family)